MRAGVFYRILRAVENLRYREDTIVKAPNPTELAGALICSVSATKRCD